MQEPTSGSGERETLEGTIMAAVGDIFEIIPVCWDDVAAQAGLNVLTYRVTNSVGTGSTNDAIAAAFDALFAPLYKPILSANVEYLGIRARRIHPTPPDAPVQSTTGRGPGAVVGDTMSRQTCGLLTKRTAKAGRKYRGRVYLPFPSEVENTSEGIPSVNYINLISALAVAMMQEVSPPPVGGNQSTLSQIVWHETTATWDYVTAMTVRTRWATQRRRSDFGGLNPAPLPAGLLGTGIVRGMSDADRLAYATQLHAAARDAMRPRLGDR